MPEPQLQPTTARVLSVFATELREAGFAEDLVAAFLVEALGNELRTDGLLVKPGALNG
jgi:hypothetical protein